MIIQSDREAAWDVRPSCYFDADRHSWMNGVYDNIPTINRIAAYREAVLSDDRVDEVARAMAKAMGHDYDGPVADDWDIQNDITDAARAVLKTLRGEA